MRKILTGLLVLMVAYAVYARPRDTYQAHWQLIKRTGTEDGLDFDTVYDLAAGEGNFANKNSASVADGGPFHIKSQRSDLGQYRSFGEKWQFIMCGGVASGYTYEFTLVGWAPDNGPLQVICEGNGLTGDQDVVLFPDTGEAAANTWWVEMMWLDETTKWVKSEGGANGVSLINENWGFGEICVLEVDLQGLAWIQFVFYDAKYVQQGTESDPTTVYGRRI